MNNKPHTHGIKIERHYSILDRGPVEVTYGDTTVSTLRWPRMFLFTNSPSDKRIRWAIQKAILKHDRGSVKAGEDNNVEHWRKLAAEVVLPPNEWGSQTNF